MQKLSPSDELSEIRAEIARLHLREAKLCALLQIGGTPVHPHADRRPGWPMQRAQKPANLHLQ